VQLKKKRELERLLVAAEFSEAEDDREIDDEGAKHGRPCRKWCLTALIVHQELGKGGQRNVLEDEVGEVEHDGWEE
jgi:hypothetical protein